MATLQTFLSGADPQLIGLANENADKYGIPRDLFQALISVESSWNASAKAKGSSAYGLTQLTKAAAQDVGVDPYDVKQNLQGGADYLARQYRRTGNWTDALAAYNQGYGGYQNADGQAYAKKVMQLANTSGGSNAMGSSNTNPMDDVMYDQMGNVISSGNDPDKTDMSRTDSEGGVLGFVKNQMGNVSFIILGIVIIAIAILATNKGKAVVVQAAAGATGTAA